MTTKEAITLLQSRVDLIKKDYPDIEDYAEALQMAIEALSHSADDSKKVSSSCGQENDMVYRQAVIDDIDEWIEIYGEYKCVDAQDILKQAKRSIKKLPSAQPELIEQGAYVRGFEQGRTQGMIDAQGAKDE